MKRDKKILKRKKAVHPRAITKIGAFGAKKRSKRPLSAAKFWRRDSLGAGVNFGIKRKRLDVLVKAQTVGLILMLLLELVSSVFLLPVKEADAAGWLTGWQYRKKITIDQTKIDENLTNFPVAVKLDSANFDFSKAKSDGTDIRFTSSDGTTLLKYERERHSAGANTIFEDNFNSYTDGDLNGQGGWSGDVELDIQGIEVKEGAKAVLMNPATEKYIIKAGSLINDGQVVVYIKTSLNTNIVPQITLREGADWTKGMVNTKYGDDEKLYYYSAGVWNDSGLTFPNNAWFYVKIEWRSSDKTARFSIDGGTPTSWVGVQRAWTNGLEHIRLGEASGTTGTAYFDYIAENPINENKAEYWVKVPAVSGTVDTDIYMYYGKSDAADGADPTAVWDANYKGVWHLKDLTTSAVKESTVNNLGGTKYAANEPIETIGKIARGQSFDGANDGIVVADNDVLTQAAGFTIELWLDTTIDNGSPFNKRTSGQGEFNIFLDSNATSKIDIIIFDNTEGGYRGRRVQGAAGDIAPGGWVYLAFTYDGGTAESGVKIFKNGDTQIDDTSYSGGTFTSVRNTTSPLEMGQYWDSYWLQHLSDEFRFSAGVRSNAWLKASYNSGNNSLVSYGAEEEEVSTTVQFTSTSSSGAESVTPASLEVSLSAVSASNVSVDYTVTGGTATGGGVDYTLASGTATITAGNTTTTIDAAIIDDGIDESDETIIVTISNPVNATLAANTVHTYTIQGMVMVTGWLISSTFDTGYTGGVAFNSIMWKGSFGTGVNTVNFQLATSNCSNGASDPPACAVGGWTSYIGPDNTSLSSYITTSPGAPMPIVTVQHNNKRYYRYKIDLGTDGTSPVVEDVIVNWSP